MFNLEPRFNEMLSADAAAELNVRLVVPDDGMETLLKLHKDYRETPLAQSVAAISNYVDEAVPDIQPRPKSARGGAFMAGALAAVHLTEVYLSDVFRTRMNLKALSVVSSITNMAPHGETRQATLEQIPFMMVTLGEEGWNHIVVAPHRPVIEAWTEKACPKINDQPFVRRGFGYIMQTALQVEARDIEADLSALDRVLYDDKNPFDWDAAAAELRVEETQSRKERKFEERGE